MRILLLEDNPTLAKLVSGYLKVYFLVDSVESFEDACSFTDRFAYDVALLDRDINGEDIGMQLIEKIKSTNPTCGIIVLSAYDAIADKIAGLNFGADDYMEKPFDNEELLARIFALVRRYQGTPILLIEGIKIDTLKQTLTFKQESIPLSKRESDLFFYLIQKRGTIVSKDELLDAIYQDPQSIASNTLDVMIRNIRKKLPVNIIHTLKTRGYLIE